MKLNQILILSGLAAVLIGCTATKSADEQELEATMKEHGNDTPVASPMAAYTPAQPVTGAEVIYTESDEGQPVKGESGAYEVIDDHTVSVTVNVTRKDPSTPVVCIVRALARDGGETGRREILIPPSTDRTVQVTTTVKSYKRSFAGDIYGCGTTVPQYLTAP